MYMNQKIMKLDIKLFVAVSLCVVLVQGRYGNPGGQRTELLLKALKQLRGDPEVMYRSASGYKYNHPSNFERQEETTENDDNADTETPDNELGGDLNAEDSDDQTAGDEEDQNPEKELEDIALELEKLEQSIAGILGEECGKQFTTSLNEKLDKIGNGKSGEEPTPARAVSTSEEFSKLAAAARNVADISEALSAALDELECEFQQGNGEANIEGPSNNDDNDTEETEEEAETDQDTERSMKLLLTKLLAQRLSDLSKKGYNGRK